MLHGTFHQLLESISLLYRLSFLFLCIVGKPFIFGILISKINRSYNPFLKFSNADRALSKASTSKLFSSKAIFKVKLTSGSSSTIKIFFLFFVVDWSEVNYLF